MIFFVVAIFLFCQLDDYKYCNLSSFNIKHAVFSFETDGLPL